jgi:hypothetical protein
MSWDYQKFALWALTLLSSILEIRWLFVSIIALKNGVTISYAHNRATEIQISPWTGLIISALLLIFAIIGIIKIWKDKDEHPPL